MKEFFKSYRFILTTLVSWRIILLTLALVVSKVFSFMPSFPYAESVLKPNGPPILWVWGNFDGVHYLTIAEKGYALQFTQAFFPLYPILIKLASFVFRNFLVSALFISHFFLLLSLFIFMKLVEIDFPRSTAKGAVVFLLLYPPAFFLGSIYTESLFLFLILISFYFARQKRWLLASLSAFFASGTRFIGVFMFPAILYEYYLVARSGKIKILDMIAVLFSFGGFLIYSLYLKLNFGSFFYFSLSQQIAWQRDRFVLLPQVLFRYFKILTTVSFSSEAFLIAALEFLFFVFSASILIFSVKKIRTSYLVFSFFALLVPTFTGTLSSIPRYTLVIFPIFLSLALVKNKFVQSVFIIVFSLLSMVFISRFVIGRFIS